MTSILTNVAAMSALQTLRTIGNDMETTQAHVSSGMRVGEAKDNAAYWSIATTMRSDNKALSAVQDALGLGAAKVDTAYAGMNAAIDVVKEIKAKVTAATEQGVDKAKVQEEIKQLQQQLTSIASGASFNGQNWLVYNDAVDLVPDKTVVSGFIRSADGTVKVSTTTYTLQNTPDVSAGDNSNVLFKTIADGTDPTEGGILGSDATALGVTPVGSGLGTMTVENMDITDFADEDMADALSLVEAAFQQMTKAASQLGSISMRIGLQEDFANRLTDAIDKGIGRLVDADMNEESTRLKALQTQQQLGIQSLSIANSSAEGILSLFR